MYDGERLNKRLEGLNCYGASFFDGGEQQKQRADLRKQLALERSKHAQEALHRREMLMKLAVAEENVAVEPSGRPLAPEYSSAFRKRCDSLPPRIASRAILAAGSRLMDQAAWLKPEILRSDYCYSSNSWEALYPDYVVVRKLVKQRVVNVVYNQGSECNKI